MNSILKSKTVFAPGCAMMLYKPDLAGKIYSFLKKQLGEMDMVLTCCRHDPQLPAGTKIINVCPGCDKRFGNNYPDISTISLWEVLAESKIFSFPDYGGRSVSIMDACPTREKENVHTAIRTLLQQMNIQLVEPKNTRTRSTCCGDSFYGVLPVEKVKELMTKRASEMPLDDVVVYCISCIKSVFIGNKNPRYLPDLLFEEKTFPQTLDPDNWHNDLNAYIDQH